jgi:hypothetical protein
MMHKYGCGNSCLQFEFSYLVITFNYVIVIVFVNYQCHSPLKILATICKILTGKVAISWPKNEYLCLLAVNIVTYFLLGLTFFEIWLHPSHQVPILLYHCSVPVWLRLISLCYSVTHFSYCFHSVVFLKLAIRRPFLCFLTYTVLCYWFVSLMLKVLLTMYLNEISLCQIRWKFGWIN